MRLFGSETGAALGMLVLACVVRYFWTTVFSLIGIGVGIGWLIFG